MTNVTHYLIFADKTAHGVNAKDEADAMAQATAMGVASAVVRVDVAMTEEEWNAKEVKDMTTLSNEPTAIEIIARSIAMHPSLFADAIKTRYYEDREYAARRKDEVATHRSVMASAEAAAKALCMAADEDAEAFAGNMAAGIIALNIACKLQCLPAHVRTAAALRTWPEA